MWPYLERTRRRLSRAAGRRGPDALPDVPGAGDVAASAVAAAPSREVVIVIGRSELDRLGGALQALLGPDTTRPDTPARLSAAVAAAIVTFGDAGHGRVRVDRRPPGLYTPEAWQIRLTNADESVTDALRAAIRDGVFPR